MWEWGASHLDNDWFGITFPWFATINTTILILSSVTCQLGVHAAEVGHVARSGSLFNVAGWGLREWYTLTFIMGSIFIGGQAFEYANLISEGFLPSTNAYTSAFFLATGFHGLHVIGGLVAFLLMLGRTYMARAVHPRTGRSRDRHLLLLALRRRDLGRALRRPLPAALRTDSKEEP